MQPSTVAPDRSPWAIMCNSFEDSGLIRTMFCSNISGLSTEWHVACNASQNVCLQWGVTYSGVSDQDEQLNESASIGEWDLATDDLRLYFQIVNFVFICEILDLFGTGTNIVNIICFVKQGLKDPVNISFLGIAKYNI